MTQDELKQRLGQIEGMAMRTPSHHGVGGYEWWHLNRQSPGNRLIAVGFKPDEVVLTAFRRGLYWPHVPTIHGTPEEIWAELTVMMLKGEFL